MRCCHFLRHIHIQVDDTCNTLILYPECWTPMSSLLIHSLGHTLDFEITWNVCNSLNSTFWYHHSLFLWPLMFYHMWISSALVTLFCQLPLGFTSSILEHTQLTGSPVLGHKCFDQPHRWAPTSSSLFYTQDSQRCERGIISLHRPVLL